MKDNSGLEFKSHLPNCDEIRMQLMDYYFLLNPFTAESFFREKIESDVIYYLFKCLAYLKN